MGLIRVLSQPCTHHAQNLSRSGSIAHQIRRKITSQHAVLSESPASHVTKASELKTWITRQRSALPYIGAELEKAQDGPNAEELEVRCPHWGPNKG